MWGWAGSRPRHCLKVGADAVAWAESSRTWRGRRRHRCLLSPIPDGAVKVSSTEPNLADPAVLAARIRTLAGPSPSLGIGGHTLMSDIPRPVVLLLPDASVRAVVLQLDTLPPRADEREALIRWRLGQEQLFPIANSRVVSQIFPSGDERGAATQTVLAVAVQETVLAQYESLCESAGLVPQEVGVSSLRLFNLWVRASGGSGWQERDLCWITVADMALTMMMFHRGRLLFYRCKVIPGEMTRDAGTKDTVSRVVQECRASLEACQQRHAAFAAQDVVLCAEGDAESLQKPLADELGLPVNQMGWATLNSLGWAMKGSQRSLSTLSAMAGVSF